MAGPSRRWGRWAAVLAAAALGAVWIAVPPAAVDAGREPAAATDVRVAYHVHTSRSDGAGTVEAIAAAARRAALDVVVLTDHGDATRAVDPPRVVDGVLVIDAAEISTWGGHLVTIGGRPSPYPLRGEPAAVAEDVERLGGFAVVAHPSSSKEALRWRAWDAPFAAIEWLNADSEWRDRPGAIWRTLLAYPWRPAEALADLVDVPASALAAWDAAAARRPVVGLAAHDAHARIGLADRDEPRQGRWFLPIPSYEASFRAFANVLRLPAPLTHDPARDAAAVLDALRAGHVYGVVTGIARPGRFTFTAEAAGRLASFGDALAPAGPVTFTVEADTPPATRTQIVCDGTAVADAAGGRVSWVSDRAPGACRADVRVSRGGRERPWLVSNPIYAREPLVLPAPRAVPPAMTLAPIAAAGAAPRWTPEVRPGSSAVASPGRDGGIAFAWRLGPPAAEAPYAALALDVGAALASADRLILRASADRPTRAWIQLRSPAGGGQRWGRSVYLDAEAREVTLPFSTFLPLGDAARATPSLADVTTVLLVLDTTYANPGAEGRVELLALAAAR